MHLHRHTSPLALALVLTGCAANGPTTPAALVAQICADPARFDGQTIELAVSGVQRTDPLCTAVGCSAAMPCCNDCTAYFYLPCDGGGRLGLINGGLTCQGNDCNPGCHDTVSPSDVLHFTGTVHAGGPPTTCCVPVVAPLIGAVAHVAITAYDIAATDGGP